MSEDPNPNTAASRLSLGRTPPGACLENTIPSAFFSRCQLPRPNCQGTTRADDTIPKDDADGSQPVMDRGSPRQEPPCALGTRRSSCRNGPQPMTEAVTSHPAGTDPKHKVIGRKTSEKLADSIEAVKHRKNKGGKRPVGAVFARVWRGCSSS